MSGFGFSLQVLIVKLLSEDFAFAGSFQIVFFRGLIQFIIVSFVIYFDKNRKTDDYLFGPDTRVKNILFWRAVVGFGGIAFSFLSVERLPLGDSTVLVMLSPLFASIISATFLNEPWRLTEFFATLVSLTGVVMVARPVFLFRKEEGAQVKATDVMGETPANGF